MNWSYVLLSVGVGALIVAAYNIGKLAGVAL